MQTLKFVKMIEAAKAGIWSLDKKEVLSKDEVTEMFWQAVPKCQPFVFLNNPATYSIDTKVDDLPKLDAPFEVFSIETLANGGDFYKIPGLEYTEEEERDSFGSTECMMVVEREPNQFMVFTLNFLISLNKWVVTHSGVERAWTDYAGIFINELNKPGVAGFINVNEKVKIRTPSSGTAFHKIKKIVYIRDSRQKDVQPILGRTIDWTHRWMVRGHWRTNQGKVGKDRGGNYCVPNFTWVSEHERGPEDAPLVSKTRVVG